MKTQVRKSWIYHFGFTLLCLSAIICAKTAEAQLHLQPVANGAELGSAFVTHAGDGSDRLFIGTTGGKILVLHPGTATATTFLDISTKVGSYNEQGLRSLAFHPDYAENGRFFVNYVRRSDNATVIAEYKVSSSDPDFAEPTEKALLIMSRPVSASTGTRWQSFDQSGGMLAFGPDGYLYISVSAERAELAQNKERLHGKILRIDVNGTSGTRRYAIPPDNPFAGDIPGRDELFALGLHSPRRFSFDRATGALRCGDVSSRSWEEINLITKGGNYGYPFFEGTHCISTDPAACDAGGYIAPVIEYDWHTLESFGVSARWVTGGYAYRGAAGTFSQGAYIFADFQSGSIFQWHNGRRSLLLGAPAAVASFGEDEAGELYICGHNGKVYRLAGTGLAIYSTRMPEGNTGRRNAELIVRLHPTPRESLVVNYVTQDGTALAGRDYIARTGQLTFAAGESEKTIAVPIIGDTIPEPEEAFSVRISNSAGIPLVRASAGVFIQNDDGVAANPLNGDVSVQNKYVAAGEPFVITTRHSDGNGFADIATVNMHFGGPILQAREGLRCRYDVATNKLYLLDDSGTRWLGGFAPGSANVISNGRGSLSCAQTIIYSGGTLLNIKWHVRPARSFIRSWPHVRVRVQDRSGAFAGYELKSRWYYTDGAPINVAVSPNDTFSSVRLRKKFMARYVKTQSGPPLRYGYLQIGANAKGTNAMRCMLDFERKLFYLRNDDDTQWLGGFAPGSPNVISNSQGSLHCSGSGFTTGATEHDVYFTVMPAAKWLDTTQKMFLLVRDKTGQGDGWDELGKWRIQDDSPVNTSLFQGNYPPSGYTYATYHSHHEDPDGDISQIYLRVGADAATGFICRYDTALRQYYVRNEADTEWIGPMGMWGGPPSLSTSRGVLWSQYSYANQAWRGWDVSWRIGVLAPLHNSRQPIAVLTEDRAGNSSGWTPFGFWNIGE